MSRFHPEEPLTEGVAAPECRAVVIMPARNEEAALPGALDALARQVECVDPTRPAAPLPSGCFEILLLLNNCTDGSARVAREWGARHPKIALHVIERGLPAEDAHVGTARRMLMDTAWHRLRGRKGMTAILSTDADTLVARDWVAQNLAALQRGADAVGGMIALKPGDLKALPEGARRGYLRDRRYQRLVAELEDRLDPQACDPWPRHLQHFGASLGCTPEIYARAGGLPPVKPLEDVAFVNALRFAGARLRHEPKVKVYTSSRLDGRAEVGLSGQLGIWQRMQQCGEQQIVLTAEWLAHRFTTLQRLRLFCAGGRAEGLPQRWMERLLAARALGLGIEEFLAEIDCERLIAEAFKGEREGEVVRVNRTLAGRLGLLEMSMQSRDRCTVVGRTSATEMLASPE